MNTAPLPATGYELQAIGEADRKLLPLSMQELASVVGIPAMLEIVRQYGGIHLYVPKKVDETHPLYAAIGVVSFTSLVNRYAGEVIFIARCFHAMITIRDRKVRADLLSGLTKAAIARKYRITERHVWNIEMKGEAVEDRNLRLF